jgi:hypothetical protein
VDEGDARDVGLGGGIGEEQRKNTAPASRSWSGWGTTTGRWLDLSPVRGTADDDAASMEALAARVAAWDDEAACGGRRGEDGAIWHKSEM